MRILYGVNGEGLGHATRSRVVIQHLIDRGHEVKVAASGRAYPYLQQHLPDVEQIWGLSFALEHGQVDVVKTVVKNVRAVRYSRRRPFSTSGSWRQRSTIWMFPTLITGMRCWRANM